MADVFSKSERSKIMQRVKSSGNKSTEEKLIQYFDEKHKSFKAFAGCPVQMRKICRSQG